MNGDQHEDEERDENIGRRLGDRFVVEASLGAGGMGSIYRGRDERLDEAVAIKFLKRGFATEPLIRERFRREALSLAKLRHPGIVTVLDFGEDNGELYTVLELVHGTTLGSLRPANEGLHVLRAAPIFDQILAALETCHEHDIVHRDIKPSNIMITTVNGIDHVKIIDFGLARMASNPNLETLTESGTVQGTPHYMAPEQCRGEEVTPATDVYSTGIVVYETLAGTLPFRGHDAATFMAQHLFVEPTPLREIATSVSAGVSAAVQRALSKQPSDRPTAKELRALLASAFKGTDPEALAELASKERQRQGGLPRADRALTRPDRPLPAAPTVAPPIVPIAGHVVVWMPNDERSAELRGSLGTAGLSCSLWTKPEPPDTTGNVIALIPATNLERIALLRSSNPKLPIIVVDVRGPEETTAAIRFGANDMLLREAPLADLAPKIKKQLRRRANKA